MRRNIFKVTGGRLSALVGVSFRWPSIALCTNELLASELWLFSASLVEFGVRYIFAILKFVSGLLRILRNLVRDNE